MLWTEAGVSCWRGVRGWGPEEQAPPGGSRIPVLGLELLLQQHYQPFLQFLAPASPLFGVSSEFGNQLQEAE